MNEPSNTQELLESAFETWRQSLVDLSNRNRLINLRYQNKSPVRIVNAVVDELYSEARRISGWKFHFPDDPPDDHEEETDGWDNENTNTDDLTDVRDLLVTAEKTAASLNKKLANLARRSRQIFEERALRVLYLTIGQLEWSPPGSDVTTLSPLVLIPIELHREGPGSDFEIRFVDEDVLINPALRVKLEADLGFALPDDWEFEDKPLSEELAEIEVFANTHGWTVHADVELAVLQFQKMAIYEDLLRNKESVLEHDLIRALIIGHDNAERGNSDDQIDGSLDGLSALDTMTILDADSSQLECIRAARDGKSFVIQGPPGTGKSQTIANLIADQMMRGKRVLFVSEKIAALEVVQNRLAEKGLDHFVLALHSDKASRKNVVGELCQSLEFEVGNARGENGRRLNQFETCRSKLNSIVRELHRKRPELFDDSVFSAAGRVLALSGGPFIKGAPTSLSGDPIADLDRYTELLQRLQSVWELPHGAATWDGLLDLNINAAGVATLDGLLEQFQVALQELDKSILDAYRETGVTITDAAVDLHDAADLLDHLAVKPPALDVSWLRAETWSDTSRNLVEARGHYESRIELREKLHGDFPCVRGNDPVWPSLDPLTDCVAESCSKWGIADSESAPAVATCLASMETATAAVATLEALKDASRRVANRYGLEPSAFTFEFAAALGEFSHRAFENPAPVEEIWLNSTVHSAAKEQLASVTPSILRCQEIRETLASTHTDDILSIDGKAAVSTFEAAGGAFKRAFDSEFKELKRKTSGCAKAKKFDFNATRETVLILAEFQKLEREINGQTRPAELLGSGYRGITSDLEVISNGLDLAGTAIELFGSDLKTASSGIRIISNLPSIEKVAALNEATDLARLRTQFEGELGNLTSSAKSLVFDSHSRMEEIEIQLRAFVGDMQAVDREVAALSSNGSNPWLCLEQLNARELELRKLESDCRMIERTHDRWRVAIGVNFSGDATDWTELEAHHDWIERTKAMPGGWPLSRTASAVLVQGDTGLFAAHANQLRETWKRVDSLRSKVASKFDGTKRIAGRSDTLTPCELGASTLTTDAMRAIAERLRDSLPVLQNWVAFVRIANDAARDGWSEFVKNAFDSALPAALLVDAGLRSIWTDKLEAVLRNTPELSEFNGTGAEKLRSQFAKLDRQLIADAPARVAAEISVGAPSSQVWQGSEKSLLMREGRKKGRFMSVRRLFESIPTLLPQLKPCMMMSPLTVSTFLSPKQHFDLVVFDEASQVRTEDSANCIYRGAQLIVAGDDKQLPPTSFFDVSTQGDEFDTIDDDEYVAVESLLDECVTRFPTLPLLWHYRSRDEQLIAFSNQRFYSGRLITFPSPRLDDAEFGVKFRLCDDGRYDRGSTRTNRAEARAVAKRAFEILAEGETESIGIIAFSSAQEAAIEEELDELRLMNPAFEPMFSGDRLTSVFVKNLESVQGDERDVILLSVGYGPDQDGKLSSNFGPVNKSGGERRLNVAITRARKRLEVFASFTHNQLDPGGSQSAGARILKKYLEFAEHGPQALKTEFGAGGEPDSEFEIEVIATLRQAGWTVHPQVGVSGYRIDIGVVDPGKPSRYLVGVECDGASYHSSPTARERDRLREEVLRNQGWHLIRVWSTDWFHNRNEEEKRLLGEIEAFRSRPEPTAPKPIKAVELSVNRRRLEELEPSREVYRDWFARSPIPLEEISAALIHDNAERLRSEFGGVNDSDIFIKALARSLGYSRTTADLKTKLDSALAIDEPVDDLVEQLELDSQLVTANADEDGGVATLKRSASTNLPAPAPEPVPAFSSTNGHADLGDRRFLQMLVDGKTKAEIKAELGISHAETDRRIRELAEHYDDPTMRRGHVVRRLRRDGFERST